MNGAQLDAGRGAWRRALWPALLLGLTAAVGCEGPGGPRLPREEESRISARAQELLLRAARDEDPVVRSHAFEALVSVLPEQGRSEFRAALRDPNPLIRYAGCVSLGVLRDRTALSEIQPLLRDSSPRVRLAAACASYRCGQKAAARLLVSTLSDHPDENLRADAAYLIGKLGDPSALPRLEWAASNEKSGKVQVHIAAARAMLGDDDGVNELINAIQGDAVSRLVALQTFVEAPSRRAHDALRYRLNDERDYLQTRLIAARALGRLGDDAGFTLALESLFHQGADPNETMSVRQNAALALGAIGSPQALASLARLAETEGDPRTQVAACWAICQIRKN